MDYLYLLWFFFFNGDVVAERINSLSIYIIAIAILFQTVPRCIENKINMQSYGLWFMKPHKSDFFCPFLLLLLMLLVDLIVDEYSLIHIHIQHDQVIQMWMWMEEAEGDGKRFTRIAFFLIEIVFLLSLRNLLLMLCFCGEDGESLLCTVELDAMMYFRRVTKRNWNWSL